SGDAPRVVILADDRPELLGRRLDDAPFYAPPGSPTAVVALGTGAAAGHLTGVVRAGAALRPLDGVRVAGPGLAEVRLHADAPDDDDDDSPALPWPAEEVWSRTIG